MASRPAVVMTGICRNDAHFSAVIGAVSLHHFTGTSFRLGTSGKNKSFPV